MTLLENTATDVDATLSPEEALALRVLKATEDDFIEPKIDLELKALFEEENVPFPIWVAGLPYPTPCAACFTDAAHAAGETQGLKETYAASYARVYKTSHMKHIQRFANKYTNLDTKGFLPFDPFTAITREVIIMAVDAMYSDSLFPAEVTHDIDLIATRYKQYVAHAASGMTQRYHYSIHAANKPNQLQAIIRSKEVSLFAAE